MMEIRLTEDEETTKVKRCRALLLQAVMGLVLFVCLFISTTLLDAFLYKSIVLLDATRFDLLRTLKSAITSDPHHEDRVRHK